MPPSGLFTHRRYWEIDGGGPAERRLDAHVSEDFLVPQIAQQDGKRAVDWAPGFLDYLFLAFNTSAAFSPTDTPVLSRMQAIIASGNPLFREMAGPNWRFVELRTGHYPMFSRPEIWRQCSWSWRLVRPCKTTASAAPEGVRRSPNFAERPDIR